MAKTFSGYKLEGRTKFQGLNISIENERGSVRRGEDPNGKEWSTFMHIAYGYIRASEGVDGDHVDCYLGNNPFSSKVFIIHQQDPVTKKYDEDKVMLGFNTANDARKSYTRQYDRPGYFQDMTPVDMDTFKDMLKKRYGMKLKKSLEKAKAASLGSVSKDGKHVKAGKGKWVRMKSDDPRRRGAKRKTAPKSKPKAKKKPTPDAKLVEQLKKDGLYKETKGGKPTVKIQLDPKELVLGIKVEMEHTKSPRVARQIALDHLVEDPKYYTKLKKIEKAKRAPIGAPSKDGKRRKVAEGKWIPVSKPKSLKMSSIESAASEYLNQKAGWTQKAHDDLSSLNKDSVKGRFKVYQAPGYRDTDMTNLIAASVGILEDVLGLDKTKTYYVSMKEGVNPGMIRSGGGATYQIDLQPRMGHSGTLEVLTHELAHVAQRQKGDLSGNRNWKGAEIGADVDYNDLPWEVDARAVEASAKSALYERLGNIQLSDREKIENGSLYTLGSSGGEVTPLSREDMISVMRKFPAMNMGDLGELEERREWKLQKAFSRQHLVPVQRMVTRKGKTFAMTFWVARGEAKKIEQQRKVVPMEEEKPIKAGRKRRNARFIMEAEAAIQYAPGSKRQIDRSMELQAQLFPEGPMTGADTLTILKSAGVELQHILELEGKGQDSGRDWYTTAMVKTRATLMKIFPELVDDDEWNKMAALIAVTSPGMKVPENLELALKVYEGLKLTGTVPIMKPDGSSWPGKNTKEQLTLFNEYMNKLGGVDEFMSWLREDAMGSEIRKVKDSSSIKKKTEYPNSIVFGPKVGVFYRNMLGEHQHLTIDRWAARSFYRWSNKIEPSFNSQGQWEANVDMTTGEKDEMRYVIKTLADENKLTMSEAQAMFWYYEKRLYSKLSGARNEKKELSYDDAANRAYDRFIASRG